MRTASRIATACVFGVLLVGCESDEEGGVFNPENRRITEITGVEYYDGFEGAHYSRYCRHRFFYDDEGRLDRWTETTNTTETDLEFYYESASRILLFGTQTDPYSGETPIYNEIELDAAGRVARHLYADDTSWSYIYSGGLLTGSYYSDANSEYMFRYTWTNGDLTRIDYPATPHNGSFQEAAYGSVPNIANLDLNYLAYTTNVFDVGSPGQMLRITGMLGRNAHFAIRNTHEPTDTSGVITEIEWTFDASGYPTGWKSLHRDLGAPKKDSGWEYTIYYE